MTPSLSAAAATTSSGLLALCPASAGEGSTVHPHHLDVLVVACQRGEPLAFDRLVRAIEGPMLRLATMILGDPVAAEDAFVEAMARVLPRIGELEAPVAFKSYARRAVRNAAVDLRRSRSRRDAQKALDHNDRLRRARPDDDTPVSELLLGDGLDPEQHALDREERDRVQCAVHALKEPGRSVLRMHYTDGLTYAAIATRTGMSRTTVKRHLCAARLTLAARLGEGGGRHDA